MSPSIPKGRAHLHEQAERLAFREGPLVLDEAFQAGTLDQIHDQVLGTLDGSGTAAVTDVRVHQADAGPGFALKTPQVFCISLVLGTEQLDRYLVAADIAAAIDITHAPLAQATLNDITVNL